MGDERGEVVEESVAELKIKLISTLEEKIKINMYMRNGLFKINCISLIIWVLNLIFWLSGTSFNWEHGRYVFLTFVALCVIGIIYFSYRVTRALYSRKQIKKVITILEGDNLRQALRKMPKLVGYTGHSFIRDEEVIRATDDFFFAAIKWCRG